jgi:hypothetical protein
MCLLDPNVFARIEHVTQGSTATDQCYWAKAHVGPRPAAAGRGRGRELHVPLPSLLPLRWRYMAATYQRIGRRGSTIYGVCRPRTLTKADSC